MIFQNNPISNPTTCYATCIIAGSFPDPAVWSSYFGIDPDMFSIKGLPFKTPSGRMSSSPARQSVWGFWSKSRVQGESLDLHIEFLSDKLNLPRMDLKNLLLAFSSSFKITCFFPNYSGDKLPTFSRELENKVEISGGSIEVDEYPQRHRKINPDGNLDEIWI